MNFVICGLPKSGTTLLARFVGGLPGVYVVHEPFQVHAKYHVWPKWPTCGYKHVGLKEPYHHAKSAALLNRGHLAILRWTGWKFIWITRDFADLRDALCQKWNWSDADVCDAYEAFTAFRANERAIDYDLFRQDPIGVWNYHNPLGVRAKEIRLAPCTEPFMGSLSAKNSTTIQ